MLDFKTIITQNELILKPIKNKDGSIDYPAVVITNRADKEEDVVDIESMIIAPTIFAGYNHYKCSGNIVATGAKPLVETLEKTKDIATMYIRVHPTDEMFFCEHNSKQKKSNGKLLEAVEKGHIHATSITFKFNPAKVKTIYDSKSKKKYNIYYEVIVYEISLLDIAPMHYESFIKNKSIMHDELTAEKSKCLNCLIEAGVDSLAINPENNVVKITKIEDDKVFGINFAGEEIQLDDTYEPVFFDALKKVDTTEDMNKSVETEETETEEEKSKSCGCNKMSDVVMNKSIDTAETVSLEDFNSLKETVMSLMSKLEELTNSMEEKSKSMNQDLSDEINHLIQTKIETERKNQMVSF